MGRLKGRGREMGERRERSEPLSAQSSFYPLCRRERGTPSPREEGGGRVREEGGALGAGGEGQGT